MIGMPTVAEIGEQRIGVPWHGCGRLSVDRIGVPVFGLAAGKLRALTFGTKRITRGMAGAAMRQPFDKVGAAIPFRTVRAVRAVATVAKEQQFPASDHKSLIERKGKLVF